MDKPAKNINLQYLSDNGGTGFIDDEIVIIDNIKELPDVKVLKTDMLMCHICTKGKIQFDINGKTHQAEEGDLITCLPNSYIENYMITPDMCAKTIGVSYHALQRHLNISKNFWNILKYIAANPVIRLDEQHRRLLQKYEALFNFKHDHPCHFYYKETMLALLRCMFLEIADMIRPHINEIDENGVLRHGEQLFKRFLELLSDSEGRERSVKAYAEQLCITPKYLSTLAKTASGKTALDWIHRFTAEAIERRLKYSDKSIKEISDEMNFPNLSFFGKFTKAHLGMSPSEYRRKLNNL